MTMILQHASSWNPIDIRTDAVYSVDWEYSNYWKQKLENSLSFDRKSLVDDMQEIIKMVGSDLDLSPLNKQLTWAKYHSELLKEYVFENVRMKEFPNRPSRKNCMFLIPAEVKGSEYIKRLGFANPNLSKWYVEILNTDQIHFADLNLLNCNSFTHRQMTENASAYWNGTNSRGYNTEALYDGNFKLKPNSIF